MQLATLINFLAKLPAAEAGQSSLQHAAVGLAQVTGKLFSLQGMPLHIRLSDHTSVECFVSALSSIIFRQSREATRIEPACISMPLLVRLESSERRAKNQQGSPERSWYAQLSWQPVSMHVRSISDKRCLPCAAQSWGSEESIQRLPVQQQAYMTAALTHSLDLLGKQQLEATPGLFPALLSGVSARLDSPEGPIRREQNVNCCLRVPAAALLQPCTDTVLVAL